MFTDLSEPELRAYTSSQSRPADFDSFWNSTLVESRALGGEVRADLVETGLRAIDVWDVTFSGYLGQPVRAWLRLPAFIGGRLPAVVEYVGYGGGRGDANESLFWAAAGFAHLQMDTRGQGSAWSRGWTADPEGSGPAVPGFLTRGIESREDYYYRRLMVDAVRAVDAARTLDRIDPERVSVLGFSQGGGLALSTAALVPDLAAAFAFVPFLCDFPRAITITDRDPYKEIGRYLAVHRENVESVMRTLAYFDGVNFARSASTPAHFSTALMDPTCPPSTVFAAHNAYSGPKSITVWPFNGHEGGAYDDERAALGSLQRLFD
ncbi:acetylxylan esterase [Parafrigoribacterium soli]|uniref:acetylxylan esterase n=1 Tax=Parafrigoribacterium soli TaxID=3144663 RepID=UPI0032ECC50B